MRFRRKTEPSRGLIETENLTRKFGDLTAVDNLTLRVDKGEVFGFLGPNGAGKTTTVRMLCCLISKTSGSARIGGYEVGDQEDALKIRKIIGLVPDNVGLYDSLTAYENLDYYGTLYRMTRLPEEGEQRALPQAARALGEERRCGGDLLEGDEAEARDSPGARSTTQRCSSWTSRPRTSTPRPRRP